MKWALFMFVSLYVVAVNLEDTCQSQLNRCRTLLEGQSEERSYAIGDLERDTFETIVELKKQVKELEEKLEICEGVK